MSVAAKGACVLLCVLLGIAAAGAQDMCSEKNCPTAVTAEFGTYGAGVWHAGMVANGDDGPRCVAFARAANSDPDLGLWLFIYNNSVRYRPDRPLPDDEYVNINTGQITMPLSVSRGMAFAPLTYPMLARAIGTSETVVIHVGVRRTPDTQEFLVYPMDGFRDAFQRVSEECGFDPTAVLGED